MAALSSVGPAVAASQMGDPALPVTETKKKPSRPDEPHSYAHYASIVEAVASLVSKAQDDDVDPEKWVSRGYAHDFVHRRWIVDAVFKLSKNGTFTGHIEKIAEEDLEMVAGDDVPEIARDEHDMVAVCNINTTTTRCDDCNHYFTCHCSQ